MTPQESFSIKYKSQPVEIDILSTGTTIIYRVNLSNSSPFFITRARHVDGHHFWTSIPEGRQREAEEIGTLVEKHLYLNT